MHSLFGSTNLHACLGIDFFRYISAEPQNNMKVDEIFKYIDCLFDSLWEAAIAQKIPPSIFLGPIILYIENYYLIWQTGKFVNLPNVTFKIFFFFLGFINDKSS